MSLLGQLKLWGLEGEKSYAQILQFCISKEDLEYLDSIDHNIEFNKQIMFAIDEVNGWGKKEEKQAGDVSAETFLEKKE